jgi:hypothetical protein
MTIRGSCLCGGVVFEIDHADGPFEICHCNRCRKLSGSIGMPTFEVAREAFRMISGSELIRVYTAPILYGPPAYLAPFCGNCGSPVPMVDPTRDRLEIPAGLLDDDPGISPDKHIFVELVPAWDRISDALPRYTLRDLHRLRHGTELPDSFEMKTHRDGGRAG